MRRRIGYAVSAFVLFAAALVVPLPLVEVAPGTATAIAPLIELDTATTPVNGSLQLLTIEVREPSLLGAVEAWLSPTRELQRREQLIPSGVEEDEFFRIQRLQFERSFRVAVAVGLRAAGRPVEVTTRPVVFSVLGGGPADGVLEAGDVVLEAQGEPLTSGDELIRATQGVTVGEVVELTVERGGERRRVEVRAGAVPGLDRPGIGIAVETIADDVELPFDAGLDEGSGIGGTSAGLMFALAVYDLVSEEDLARGRTIAGTGTIDAAGNVGAISGIAEKVAAARAAGADVVVVPASQAAVARSAAAGSDLEVVAVATLEDALRQLRPAG